MSLPPSRSAAPVSNGTTISNATWKLAALFVLIAALAVSLFGCANTKETVTAYSGSVAGVDTTITLYAQGDKVTKQTTESSVSYEALGVTTAAEAEELLKDLMSGFDGIDGVEHSVDYTETSAVENLTVDYQVAALSDVAGLPGSDFSGDADKAQYVSLKQSISDLEGQGFTEVK